MRIHKITIYCMAVVCVISFIAAWFLDLINQIFWSNIAVGMLSSGFLALVISVVGYKVERRRTMEEFYSQACKAIRNINLYDKDDNPVKKMEIVVQMESYDYSQLDTAYANIDFFWISKKHKMRIYNEIYSEILSLKEEISDKKYHFNMYLKEQHKNLSVMQIFIQELDDKLLTKKCSEISNEDGSVTNVTYIRQKAADILNKELSAWYFKLMYGKKVSE